MAAHWWYRLSEHSPAKMQVRMKLAINGVGAIATGSALAVILAAKFLKGAWITILVIPAALVVLRIMRRYYDDLDHQLLRGSHRHINVRHQSPPIVLVPIKRWDKVARKAIEYAIHVSPDVTALHLTELEGTDVNEQLEHLRHE